MESVRRKRERERERELFGVVDRVTELSRVGETRVPAPSDASHQRDVHVQARGTRGARHELGSGRAERREKGKSRLLFFFYGFCVNACGKAPVGLK